MNSCNLRRPYDPRTSPVSSQNWIWGHRLISRIRDQLMTWDLTVLHSGLSGEQLAFGKLTAHVLVNTLEGRCIGETRYTYNTNLQAQFEHCVKALDDEDMELEFTVPTEEQHVTLNYRRELKLNPNFLSTLLALLATRVRVFDWWAKRLAPMTRQLSWGGGGWEYSL